MTLQAQNQAVTLPVSLRNAFAARISGKLELPLFPDTAARVMEACREESCDLKTLADLITHDQSLAAHVLRVANSAAYAPREPIVSIQQAIARLGVTLVCDVVVAVSLKGRVFSVPGYQVRLRELWMHSAATAAYSKEIAALLREETESIFLCGLLHDIGMPLAMQIFCDLMRDRGVGPLLPSMVEAVMAEYHRELGATIAQRWGLGSSIGAAIRFHHDPMKAGIHQREVLVTAFADELAYWALDDRRGNDDFPSEHTWASALGLSTGNVLTLLDKRARVLAVTEAFLSLG